MFARVGTIAGSPSTVDLAIRSYRDQTIPAARGMAGFNGAMLLVDRQSGKFVSVTLWETEADLRASEAAANRLRAQAAETAASKQAPTVEVYEVAVHL